ncbi:Hypothetical predicted protein [Paramuricea clavata]|uniref:Uncharacterized protein n=1 Tax=Paramuricea clavata TaxID=317549 RepID=A0A7D9EQJ0_PARCT|nr:Hypothetical predicted protein [Paramuricea clavata]
MKNWKRGDIKRLVGMYHEGENYSTIVNCLESVGKTADTMDEIKMPLLKIVAVRICSERGIETGIADAREKYVVLRAEDVLYGKIYPKLGWEPVGCEYYREWLVRKCKERNELNKLNLDEKIADARIKVDHSGGVSDKVREEYGYIYGSSCRNCGNRFISGSNEIRDRCKRRICGGCSKVTTPKLGCVRSHSRGQACDFRGRYKGYDCFTSGPATGYGGG